MLWLIIIALVQGITEFIPVSSSGHESLIYFFNDSLDLDRGFIVMTHIGTLMSVLVWYRRQVLDIAKEILLKQNWSIAGKLALATLPGILAGAAIASLGIEFTAGIVGAALIVGGVLFIWYDWDYKGSQSKGSVDIDSLSSISFRQFLLIGLAQSVAIIPGVSRSGATILAASMLGVSRSDSIDVSFLLSIPLVAGAGLYEVVGSSSGGSVLDAETAVAMLIAFVSGLVAIKLCKNLVVKYGLKPFGYYRILLGFAVLLALVIT